MQLEHTIFGLTNEGNTCYMNVVIQCLAAYLGHYLRTLVGWGNIDTFPAFNPEKAFGGVMKAFAELLKKMEGAEKTHSGGEPFSTNDFVAVVARRSNNMFQASGDQHDAHDFLVCLMDWLNEELWKTRREVRAERLGPDFNFDEFDPGAKEWYEHLNGGTSFMLDVFSWQMRSTLTCNVCNMTSVTYDSVWEWSLSLAPPGASSDPSHCPSAGENAPKRQKREPRPLIELIEEYLKDEDLDENNKWVCPRCKKKVSTKKSLALWKLPPVLIICLKRFRQDGTKITDVVNFPLDGLDLSVPCESPQKVPPIYDCIRIIEHHDRHPSNHYTMLYRSSVDNSWLRCDDGRVTRAGDPSPSGDSYILFYRRRSDGQSAGECPLDIPEQWPSKPEWWPHQKN